MDKLIIEGMDGWKAMQSIVSQAHERIIRRKGNNGEYAPNVTELQAEIDLMNREKSTMEDEEEEVGILGLVDAVIEKQKREELALLSEAYLRCRSRQMKRMPYEPSITELMAEIKRIEYERNPRILLRKSAKVMLDSLLNDCLNKAMCGVNHIQNPNSNKIADFVTNYLKDL